MKKLPLLFFVLCLSSSAFSAEAKRPKIGLVLGGGGAKAGTQLGVLRVMEELRIPVDFVAGTSMGSFIGMLYASGYSLKEIEDILNHTDWNHIFLNSVNRNDRPMRRKEEDLDFLTRKKLGIKNGTFVIGTGIADTQNLRNLIRELTLHVATIKDFDKLPLPYRAVAMDLADGSEAVQSKGELPDAVRASMSLPGIFPPVIIDGKYLVDGGSINNLPMSVAKKAGMDVVIAVDVGAAYYKPEEITTFMEVIDQITMYLTHGNTLRTYAAAGPKDVIIRPDLTGLSTESYEKISEGFPRGEEAARKVIDKLRAYSVSEEEYAAFRARRERPNREPPVIDRVRPNDKSKYSDKVIKQAFKVKEGQKLDVAALHKNVSKTYAREDFSEVYYDLQEKDGKTDMIVHVKDNDDYRNYMKFGLRLYADLKGSATFGAGVSYDVVRINPLGAEWQNQLEVGDFLRLSTEFYQPLEGGLRYFIAPKISLGRKLLDLYSGSSLTTQILDSYTNLDFVVGRHFSNFATLRAGFDEEFGNVDNRIGAFIPIDKYNVSSYFTQLRTDTLDNTNVPHSGIVGNATWAHAPSGLGSDFTYEKLSGRWGGFLPAGAKNTFSMDLEGGTHFGGPLPVQEFYTLGGLGRLTGFQKDEVSGQYMLFSRVMYYRRLGANKLAIKSIPTYFGITGEAGNTWLKSDDISVSSAVAAGSGFFLFDTFVGPIILGGGYNTENRAGGYIIVGRWY